MQNSLANSFGFSEPDNLIAKAIPAAKTFGVVIEKLPSGADDTIVKRGTLLGRKTNGKMTVFGGSPIAKAEKFSGDASATEFTVSDKPAAISGVKVDGADAAIADYNIYTGVLTLAAAPAAGTDNIEVSYVLGVDATPCAILADDVKVGTDADAAAVAYRCGNFNPAAVILAEGCALTVQDKDTLRKYGIIFTQMLNA